MAGLPVRASLGMKVGPAGWKEGWGAKASPPATKALCIVGFLSV